MNLPCEIGPWSDGERSGAWAMLWAQDLSKTMRLPPISTSLKFFPNKPFVEARV
jgi:hypothetical protein